MRVTCSNCGATETVVPQDITAAIQQGWGSYGSAIYCPQCKATWAKRNPGRPMADKLDTAQRFIDMLAAEAKPAGLIVDAEMPDGCETCFCCQPDAHGVLYTCGVNEADVMDDETGEVLSERPSWCPLREV